MILLDWDTVESIEVDFQDVLDQISAITVAEESDAEEEDENTFPDKEPELNNNKAELSLTFHRNTDEYSTVELDFYQYDGSYCISVLNGDEMNYTDRSSVVDLKEAVNSVILDSETEE